MKRKVLSYIRVSTEEQTHGYSIPAQRQVLQDYAAGHDLTIVEEFVESESAFKPGRPVFERMAELLTTDRSIRAVLCYKIDRLARNMTDYARLVEKLGVDIISATEQLPSNATGQLMGNMQAAFSTYFSHQLSERVTLGLETKARKGLWPSYAPVGYLNQGEGIVPDPARGDLVRKLFETYARTGLSVKDLTMWARDHGLRTRQGGTLTKSSIHSLLSHPIYIGMVRWKGVLYEGKHEPLISRALFKRVQDQLHGRGHAQSKPQFPYRGLVVCGHCGCQMTAAYAKKKYVYYRCTGARGDCSPTYIRQDRLGDALASVVKGVHMTSKQVSTLLQAMHDREEERETDRQRQLERLGNRLEAIDRRRETSYEDKLDGKLAEERWLEMDRKWAQEAFQTKCEMETLGKVSGPSPDDVEATLELLKRAPELYWRRNDAERAQLLRVLVWNCRLTDGKVDPVYRKPFDLVAEGLRSDNWYA
jgi:DNA invertase Pin-like site-specific DNA recombinase